MRSVLVTWTTCNVNSETTLFQVGELILPITLNRIWLQPPPSASRKVTWTYLSKGWTKRLTSWKGSRRRPRQRRSRNWPVCPVVDPQLEARSTATVRPTIRRAALPTVWPAARIAYENERIRTIWFGILFRPRPLFLFVRFVLFT